MFVRRKGSLGPKIDRDYIVCHVMSGSTSASITVLYVLLDGIACEEGRIWAKMMVREIGGRISYMD